MRVQNNHSITILFIDNKRRSRPHCNDLVRWEELIQIAGVLQKEPEIPDPIKEHMLTIDEFMASVERRMRKNA